MKILVHFTTLDGEPIPGYGDILEGRSGLEVVERMRNQTPFTACRANLDYMTEVLAGIETQSTPLPEDIEAAAIEFLTRLAKHGLIEFLYEAKLSDPLPVRFLEAIEAVRLSGLTNMLDRPEVARLMAQRGDCEVAAWVMNHRREYAAFLFGKMRPFDDKEVPSACVDK